MGSHGAKRAATWGFLAATTFAVLIDPIAAQPGDGIPSPSPGAWTLGDAREHLRLFPRDVYMQYVALQLARREGALADVAAEISRHDPTRNQWDGRRDQVTLFSIFSGSLAVQESLQLDAMTVDEMSGARSDAQGAGGRQGPLPLDGPAARTPTNVPVDSVAVSALVGPAIKSHPWKEMLGDKQPQVTGLALAAPADFYFVSFRSVNKLLEAADLSSLWGAHLFNHSTQDARSQLVNQRLREQLAVDVNPALAPFYDTVVDEAAIVGSDLFLREGSDVTLLFHVKQPQLFRAQMDQFLSRVNESRVDAIHTTGQYLGVDWEHVATPDRRIHAYSAYPSPELHVRTNSQAALERVLETIAGRDAAGQPAERLGETDEFRYVRTLLPQGASEEDGFIYLSDPFVRRLMGPGLRLTERRRMVCYNNLRMIGHAALMHRTQVGRNAKTLADLTASQCAPAEFGQGRFACPDHGQYTLAADGFTGVCSRHGYASYLTPCDEIETTQVTDAEAAAYNQFVQDYNGFWRQFFDPIAIRLSITPERYRAETIVLPLIDNSIYTGLSRALGGTPEPLDALPVPKRNIFSVAVRLNKAQLLHDMGLDQFIDAAEPGREEMLADAEAEQAATNMRQLILALLNYHDAHRGYPPRSKGGLSWRVELLPFLGHDDLYREFHRNEPWDSEHNRKLIARIPPEFQSGAAALTAAGKTRFVVPAGESTVFPPNERSIRIAEVSDGTSNTAILVEADDEHAVIWTKPDDLRIDALQPARGLAERSEGAYLVGMCDGSLHMLRKEIPPATLAAVFTRNGNDVVDWQNLALAPPRPRGGRRQLEVREAEMFADLRLGEVLNRGVGNQIGFHVYDADPLFDLNMSQVLGGVIGTFRGRGMINDEFLFIVPLVGALNGPVYVSIPVQDAEIVDGFLDRLDKYLVEFARQQEGGGFFRFEQEFYHLPTEGGRKVRAYVVRLGPFKWRFFWSRIGNGLYVASKREVLDDLAALDGAGPGATVTSDAPAHGMVRLRPQHWDRVLEAYRLGWEENNREACLRNTGPLSSLTRALAAGRIGGVQEVTLEELTAHAARLYDVHHFCPDEGHYLALPAGEHGASVECTLHGWAREPRQGEAPVASSELGELMRGFRDMHVALTFLDDGLHAVATIERVPARDAAPSDDGE